MFTSWQALTIVNPIRNFWKLLQKVTTDVSKDSIDYTKWIWRNVYQLTGLNNRQIQLQLLVFPRHVRNSELIRNLKSQLAPNLSVKMNQKVTFENFYLFHKWPQEHTTVGGVCQKVSTVSQLYSRCL